MHKKEVFSSKWISTVENWLNELGMTDIWKNQRTSINWFKRAVKLRLEDQYKQKWHSQVFENEKCKNYRIFKDNFGFERYLIDLPKCHATRLCNFRTGNHQLPVARLQYEDIPRENRICNMCDLEVGDEFHVLFNCNFFKNTRKRLLRERIIVRPNCHKFKNLMNTNDQTELVNLCHFIKVINGYMR